MCVERENKNGQSSQNIGSNAAQRCYLAAAQGQLHAHTRAASRKPSISRSAFRWCRPSFNFFFLRFQSAIIRIRRANERRGNVSISSLSIFDEA